MENNQDNRQKIINRRTLVWAIAAVVIIFVFIFSMFHLQQRGKDVTPENPVTVDVTQDPEISMDETQEITSASQEQAEALVPQYELEYSNASLNSDSYQIQTAGLRLAIAYFKAGQIENGENLISKLMEQFSYDPSYESRCKEILKEYIPSSEPTE